MAAYLTEVRKLERCFLGLEVKHVLRRDNQLTDELARMSSSGAPSPVGIFEERLSQPSVSVPVVDEGGTLGVGRVPGDPPPAGKPSGGQAMDGHRVAAGLDTEVESWIQPIQAYLCGQAAPEDDASVEKVARQAKRYALVDGHLYRRGANGTLQKCITREEGSKLLSDIHEDEYGSHSSSRTLVGKAFRQGFY